MLPKNIVKCIVVFTCLYQSVQCVKLEKVLVLSRHNIRTPLDKDLHKYTPKKFPKWSGLPGELTPKGALLERYLGEYFSKWLQNNQLFTEPVEGTSSCPDEKSVFIFANSIQRTIDTAEAFTETAFPNCNYFVNYNHTTYPGFVSLFSMFSWLIKNNTYEYKIQGEQEMRDKLDKCHLQDMYSFLNDITDVQHSDLCKNLGSICDFVKKEDIFKFSAGRSATVAGRFSIAKAIVDAFVMSFYEGHPLKDVAWGHIKTDDQWKTVTKILNAELEVRFNLKYMSDAVKPFMKFLKKEFSSNTKFSFVCGHDSTIRAILTSLGFIPFTLPEQYEPAPVGGKLVFQKWTDGAKDFLKVEYIYQSWTQIRDGTRFSSDNLPKNVSMSLNYCIADENGLCPWIDFERILNEW